VVGGQSTTEVYDESKPLTLIDKVPGDQVEFSNKVKDIAKRLGINPNWIMAVIYKESKFNHVAVNKDG
jgi:soluble lytic murein transglycosylase-like protein